MIDLIKKVVFKVFGSFNKLPKALDPLFLSPEWGLIMGYFFAAVSIRKNLETCKKFALAGFPETENGGWAFVDIDVGDFISFLYGGRAHNLYRIEKKEALESAENMPPSWEPIATKKGRIFFPYRLYLQPVREFSESLARTEFSYIAENLIRRGGIRKSHFQADQVTLSYVSGIERAASKKPEILSMPPHTTFVPRFVKSRKNANLPKINLLREEILHSILRHHLSNPVVLKSFLEGMNLSELAEKRLEILSERALERGYVDLLIKEAEPEGIMNQIVIEVKRGAAKENDVKQLRRYMEEIGEECVAGAIIAEALSRNIAQSNRGIHFWRYVFNETNLEEPHTFEELLSGIRINKLVG